MSNRGKQWRSTRNANPLLPLSAQTQGCAESERGYQLPAPTADREVELTPEKEREVEEAIREVKEISDLPTPPDVEFMKICKSCSYMELCWS